MILPFKKDDCRVQVCNKCGGVIDDFSGSLIIKDVHMPYLSRHDYDLLNLTLCVDCLDRLVDGCAINPITEYTGT